MKILKIIFVFFLLMNTNCKKDDDDTKTALEQLPPATQSGAQTFGCLINGKAFIPDTFGSGRPSAFYQFVNGSYSMSIGGYRGNSTELESISFGAIDVKGLKKQAYNLVSRNSGNFYGLYLIGGGIILEGVTKEIKPGKLTITNLDEEKFIISGTFEFTVLDADGKEINITDGRFDLNYTN